MINKMSAGLREAMVLRFLQSLSYKQIAVQLNVPEACIRKRIERGAALLRRELEDGHLKVESRLETPKRKPVPVSQICLLLLEAGSSRTWNRNRSPMCSSCGGKKPAAQSNHQSVA